jgi:pilus assembly protein CpaF
MGAIDQLLKDTTVEDISINGPSEVMVYRHGKWEDTDISFPSADRLLEILNRGLAYSNVRANVVTPIADAVLKGKERISVATYPVSSPNPTAVIRVPRAVNITLKDMVKPYTSDQEDKKKEISEDYEGLLDGDTEGMLSPKAALYLHAVVLSGGNIVVVGPTGSGKTTLLMALGRLIPKGERILIIEDTPEINLHPDTKKPHNVLYLRTRPATVEGLPEITQEDLVKCALRQRPDALTLGEARGAEVFDLLNALNTGHKNGLTSLHAYGVEELFSRVYLMLSQSERGRHLDSYRAANLVASSLNVAVSIEMAGMTRYVKTIAELTGKVKQVGNTYEPEVIPVFQRSGKRAKLDGPVVDSNHSDLFRLAGIPKHIYSAG